MCKHRFGVQLLQNPPLCTSTEYCMYSVHCTYHRYILTIPDLSSVHTGTLTNISCLAAKVFTESIQFRRYVLMFFFAVEFLNQGRVRVCPREIQTFLLKLLRKQSTPLFCDYSSFSLFVFVQKAGENF